MAGLRTFIRSKIPYSWEVVLREEKKINIFIEYIYRDTPSSMKGKAGWRRGASNVLLGFQRCSIHEMFNTKTSKEGTLYWYKISNKIKDYEYQNH